MDSLTPTKANAIHRTELGVRSIAYTTMSIIRCMVNVADAML